MRRAQGICRSFKLCGQRGSRTFCRWRLEGTTLQNKIRTDNADMSRKKQGKNPCGRKSKVFVPRLNRDESLKRSLRRSAKRRGRWVGFQLALGGTEPKPSRRSSKIDGWRGFPRKTSQGGCTVLETDTGGQVTCTQAMRQPC